ncbi:ectonucleoside triphosphate diphosphohydrolase 2-like [Malaclemys terrapin pileata]|uniref:ectonucleoside triphosphate diphosphohydrolase 2-like n=1 Tax=Malaclemys terrapin pileata TaxID=2991368 RepID=UPI0023A8B13A|nr:ectonucleoside triphosphate diphosphohydrolase 2-like [Malaclemys terrapin pileata]
MSWRELLPPSLVILAGLIGILLLCVTTKDVQNPPRCKYGIVLDAGPSRTTLFIYQWSASKENNTGVISEHSSCAVQGPGISSYSRSPGEAGNSLKLCLGQAMKEIPKEQHDQTPIYLGATAGMRLLNLTSPTVSDTLLAAVTATLKSYPFDFRGAEILSSQNEGVFGWVTVNYLLENFIKYGWIGRWSRSRKGTVGVMTIGEAPTRLTFKIKERSTDPENEVTLRLYGQEHRVYTHHFPCSGTDQLRQRLLLKAIQDHGYVRDVSNPCWPLSYPRAVRFGSVHDGPCTGSNASLRTPTSEDVFQVTGSSNSSACRKLMGSLFDSSLFCGFSQCSLNGVFQPNITRFQVISEALDLVKKMTPSTDLGQAVDSFCGLSVEELSKRFQMTPDSLADHCSVSTFIYYLSTRGFLFDLDSSGQITFQEKVGNLSAGWALGYMLNLTNTIPEDKLSSLKAIEYGIWPLLFILFVLMLTGSFTRIAYRVMAKDNGEDRILEGL